jgi:hypothetical protein
VILTARFSFVIEFYILGLVASSFQAIDIEVLESLGLLGGLKWGWIC